jgi:drug/metabolite transporter (DMT)-like permease
MSEPGKPRTGGYAAGLALLSAALFGAAIPASKWLLVELGPFQLAGLLYLGAAVATAPVRDRAGPREPRRRLDLPNRGRLVGAVVAGGLLGPVFLLFGLQRAPAGSVALLLNLEMAATAVLGVVLFREHLGRGGWIGVLGVVGAGALVSWGGGWPGLAAAVLVAVACLCWGLDNHWSALIDGMHPARITFWKGLVAGSANLTIGLVGAPFGASPVAVATALIVGALCYGASIVLYIRSAHQLGATRAQAFFASAPFIGAALSFAWLDEPVGWQQVAGAALLAISVAALFRSRHEHAHVHEAVEHVHSHRHDDGHHAHAHPGLSAVPLRHSHRHRHEKLVHSHPHWPDVHHRHPHGPGEEAGNAGISLKPKRGASRSSEAPARPDRAADRTNPRQT